jgi:hypothetical protein
MADKRKRGHTIWWVIILIIIICLGIVLRMFWKGNSTIITDLFQDKSLEQGNEDTVPQDSSTESLNDNTGPQSASNETSTTESQGDGGGSGGGGGGGGSSGSTTMENSTTPEVSIPPREYKTFSSLEELFNSDNPIGDKVNLYGVAFQIAGTSTSDSFFFTDDQRVIDDINFILFNKVAHITVYNSLNVEISQSVISLTGTIVDCNQNDDGIYCVNAESIN